MQMTAFPKGLEVDAPRRLRRGHGARLGIRKTCLSRCARGARASMPGMMDTVLNLGLNDVTVVALLKKPAMRALLGTAIAVSYKWAMW